MGANKQFAYPVQFQQECDLIIHGIVLTSKRLEQLSFPHPLLMESIVIVAPKLVLSTNIEAISQTFQNEVKRSPYIMYY